jgi:hypothetical protein
MPGPLVAPVTGPPLLPGYGTAATLAKRTGKYLRTRCQPAAFRVTAGWPGRDRCRPGRAAGYSRPVRHNPSTVVVLAGQPGEQVLDAVGRSLNVVLVRPQERPAGAGPGAGGIEAAAGALRRAAGISAPYVLVAADPLSAVAEAWRDMWTVTSGPRGSDEFELRAAQTLAAWRAKQFELPDYYLALAEQATPGGPAALGSEVQAADFYLGPLRAVRPNRVSVAAAAEPAALAAAVLGELGSLRHGPWWPSLDEVFRTARGFYPGALAESPAAGQATLLS